MYVPTTAWFQQERRLAKLNGFLKSTLRERWRRHDPTEKPNDLLDKIMAPLKVGPSTAKHKDILWRVQKQNDVLKAETLEQMCYELKTFLLAGHETSAAMLAWAIYELLRHPECLAKVLSDAWYLP